MDNATQTAHLAAAAGNSPAAQKAANALRKHPRVLGYLQDRSMRSGGGKFDAWVEGFCAGHGLYDDQAEDMRCALANLKDLLRNT